ncbi:MAG: alpha-2-macroglobulin family protein [Panacagrimonas sp.]
MVAQGFEAQGGRGVAADVTQLVSSMPFLVGTKADGDLTYVGRNSERSAQLIAVDARLAKIEANALRLKRIESKYVSTLVKQRNGQFKYESRKRETQLSDEPLSIPATGYRLKLDSTTPGSYAYVVQDGGGQQLARIDYTVAGNANLSARLEKNAELQLALSKPDYAPGETLELQINAPYSGAGLITIERDKVYAWQWFRSDTTASTQRITLPAGIEGNAYVSVSFVRDPGSPEIYTSPHSYGVAPFSINVGARRSKVEVTLPARVKPGDTAEFRYRTDRPSKLILFAVDEGILQVARYLTPDPIAYLFQKRSLDVGTVQILDLILPEFRLAQMQAAPGGDADGLLAQHLNPFRRKSDVPVAYWSGIVDADTTERVLRYTVPDHFNGRLRVMALAVSGQAIGVFEGSSLVRGDFVLSPNVPGFVAPGDTFEVSLGVSNQAEGSGADAKLALKLSTGKGLQIVGPEDSSITVAEGRESTVRFALKATRELGDVELRFSAMLGSKSATRSASVSVRPAVPYQTTLSAGSLAPGKTLEIVVPRQLYPQFREQEAGISMLPLSLARGFVAYLQHYPYACTEQLVSQAMPAVVLAQQPEFGHVQAAEGMSVAKLIDELRARQTPDGAYRNWPGGFETQDFVSVYAQHVLVEAGERGQSVPRDLLDQGNAYLRQLAARDGDTLEQDRIGAYALYLLTRQGQTLGADASRLRERLDTRYAKTWRNDAAGAYLAAAMLLMKQNDEARALFDKIELKAVEGDRWYDAMTSDALWLYLASRHFPEQLADQSPALLDRIAQRTNQGRTHSLSAASSLMALDAYAAQVAPQALGTLNAAAVLKDGQPQPVRLPAGLFPKFDVSGEAIKLRFQNSGGLPAFVLLSQSGFDAEPDQAPLRQGFEILREYTDAAGKTVSEVAQGEEVTVRLKFRSLSRDRYSELALIDLLPGGFERVAPAAGAQTPIGQVSLDELQDSSDEGTATGWTCAICQPGTRAQMSYADVREDRTIFYVDMGPDMSEVVYRIKATSAGTYLVPPAYGEGMYRPDLRARSSSGNITVKPR